MSLRARLTLYFVIIVVLPVTAVTAYGWHAVARSTQRQIRSELQLARNSAAVAFDARLERAHGAVATLARDPGPLQALAAGGSAPAMRSGTSTSRPRSCAPAVSSVSWPAPSSACGSSSAST